VAHTEGHENAEMQVTLMRATQDDLPFVKNLVPYYVYDISEYTGWDPDSSGQYGGCDDLADYWQKPAHHPYLITVAGKVAGFALVRPFPEEPTQTEVGEFFVLRKFRGRGVGRSSAYWLFDTHPGRWLVRVLNRNTGALGFWRRVIWDYADGRVVQTREVYTFPGGGKRPMQTFRFASRSQPDAA
jgi:predicted acetyltransferase